MLNIKFYALFASLDSEHSALCSASSFFFDNLFKCHFLHFLSFLSLSIVKSQRFVRRDLTLFYFWFIIVIVFWESLGLGFGSTELFFFRFELLISMLIVNFMGYLLALLTLYIIHDFIYNVNIFFQNFSIFLKFFLTMKMLSFIIAIKEDCI